MGLGGGGALGFRGFRDKGLGFQQGALGFRGFRNRGLGLGIQGALGLRNLGTRVWGFGFRVSCLGLWFVGFRFQGFGFGLFVFCCLGYTFSRTKTERWVAVAPRSQEIISFANFIASI